MKQIKLFLVIACSMLFINTAFSKETVKTSKENVKASKETAKTTPAQSYGKEVAKSVKLAINPF